MIGIPKNTLEIKLIKDTCLNERNISDSSFKLENSEQKVLENLNTVFHTVADWDSMGRVIIQTRERAFQTLG